MSDQQEEKQPKEIRGTGRSLLLGGFSAFGVFILAIVLGGVFIFSGIRHIEKIVEPNSSKIVYDGPDTSVQSMARLETFFSDVPEKLGHKVDVAFDKDDLNALIVNNEQLSYLKGKFRVTAIEGSEIVCETSLPMNWVTNLEDREPLYLNGVTRFTFEMHRAKDFYLRFLGYEKNGEKSRLDYFNVLSERNLMDTWKPSLSEEVQAKINEKLSLVYDVVVEDGKVILRNWHYDEGKKKTLFYNPKTR